MPIFLCIRTGNLDWNESHDKETKDIYASAANLLSVKQEISTGANADIGKAKREKYIVFVTEKWMQCLFPANIRLDEDVLKTSSV